MTPDHIRAHRHSSQHREEILASEACGCFYYLTTFPPAAITEWTDAHELCPEGNTALCPKCGIDSVIGSESGYPVTEEFLRSMEQHWFGS
ncbi:MAG TPA: cytoplasmic protein [Bosea sp. (in: a-proteobacteria)]|jgi:hypothetical protein|uniref:cytoplasmic protein n=1 Tax=Bosea sp. (in: a-proteobacteria) TaxID=1871050 RepID=UPI002DDCACEF|nr:cytoplasmic protein [Bosea sp. (in: a-proteobacteria)]HEV2555454.1 cytoplasmic protein [Bosea sp. (in: a-proteobacteria)]